MKLLSSAVTVAILSSLAALAFAEDLDLDYRLKIDAPETGVGQMTLTVSGLSSKGFELVRPGEAGESWFDNVRAVDGARKELTVVPVDKGYYVTTEGDAKAVITYAVRPGQVRGEGRIGLICGQYAALDGSMLFLVPSEDLGIRSAVFSADVPAGWQAVTSWPSGQGYYRPDATAAPIREQLERSLISFGAFTSTSREFGLNKVTVHNLASYPAADAENLAEALFKIYGGVYDVFKFDTNIPYNVVCLPPSPDGLPVVAGAWADGQALTLAGSFTAPRSLRYAQYFARFLVEGYFVQAPFGVALADGDSWLYYAAMRYAEGLAGAVTGKMDENLFYSTIYADYAAEAQSGTSPVDLTMSEIVRAPRPARSFMENTKAPVLLMRLDFEIRAVTGNSENVDGLLAAIYGQGRNREPGVTVAKALEELTGADFAEFQSRFVNGRDVLLPTWPSFLDKLENEKLAEPGPVAAEVDGVPIYRRELDTMVEALFNQGTIGSKVELTRTAFAILVNEKLLDQRLAEYRINVVPEAFWRLRLVLPPSVMSVVVAAKRQAVKDLLYDEWMQSAKAGCRIDVKEPPAGAGQPGVASPQ